MPSSPRGPADPSRSFPVSPVTNPTNNLFSPYQQSQPLPAFAATQPPPRIASPQNQRRAAPSRGGNAPLMCLWANCGVQFSTMNELVGHVNLMHLRPASSSSPPTRSFPTSHNQNNNNSTDSSASLSCLWGNCQTFPAMQGFAGPGPFAAGPSTQHSNNNNSTGQLDAAALNMLSSHLMQDHLGLSPFQQVQSPVHSGSFGPLPPTPQQHQFGTNVGSPRMQNRVSNNTNNGMPSPNSSPSQTPEPSASESAGDDDNNHGHDCASSSHICHWHSCSRSFPTCDALTAHISSAHVGSGRSHYDCYWANCNRHGEQKGFASKQKILRHLQSHTGHRPFQCQVCHQYFSEAATLQQHMRRHTQESTFFLRYNLLPPIN